MSKKDPEIVTFGCRLNTYESEVMRTHAKDAGRQERQSIRRPAVIIHKPKP